MSWITITAPNLNAYLVAAQLDALRTKALAVGQSDPFTEISVDVVNKVRAYIASNTSNVVDQAPLTVPPELKIDVVHLILAPMLGRLGIALTEDQRKQLELAQNTLIALRDKKLLVSKPEIPVTPEVQAAGGVQAKYSPRRFTRETMEGL